MTKEQQSKMEHAIGLDHKHPVGGRYVPYRNYDCTVGEDAGWEALVEQGYAEKEPADGRTYYSVSHKGFQLLSDIHGFRVGARSLELVLKAEWYDMIERGEKLEEYREVTPYWRKRICRSESFCQMREVCKANILCHYEGDVPPKNLSVTFHRAYTQTKMTFKIKRVSIGFGNPEWGAVSGRKYYVIKLGERVL